MMGPLPWSRTPLVLGEDESWRQCPLATWEEPSSRGARTVAAAHPGLTPAHYAGKSPPGLAGELAGLLPCTAFLPVRDPRDVFPSVTSFVDKRGAPGFGMRPGEDPEELAPRLVALQRRRLQEVARAQRTGSAIVMDWEDLAADLAGRTLRLGSLLGIALDPAGVRAGEVHYQQHSTTISPNESVGRWRREMDPRTRAFRPRARRRGGTARLRGLSRSPPAAPSPRTPQGAASRRSGPTR